MFADRVEEEGGRVVIASAVVVATHSPFTTLVAMHTKQADDADERFARLEARVRGSGPRGGGHAEPVIDFRAAAPRCEESP